MNIGSQLKIKRNNSLTGEGFFKKIKELHIRKLKSRPNIIKRFLLSHGNKKVVRVKICRVPLNKMVDKALNFINLGKIEKLKKEYNYDKFFHLYMILLLDSGEQFLLEKNEIVSMKTAPLFKPGTEYRTSNTNNITFKEMILKAENSYANIYYYNSVTENCQKFIQHISKQLNIYHLDGFIIQYHVKDIINKPTKKFAYFLTTLAASGKRYILGKGKSDK